MAPEPDPLLKRLREMAIGALEERRGLVAYSRIEAQEMDQLARRIERDVLEQIRATLPPASTAPEIAGVRHRLERMDGFLQELDAKTDVPEPSRALERDDITWRTFEDVMALLGIE
ncbi:MAG: hypothetical protein ACT4PY_13075 [Armatimonadota bacterium]